MQGTPHQTVKQGYLRTIYTHYIYKLSNPDRGKILKIIVIRIAIPTTTILKENTSIRIIIYLPLLHDHLHFVRYLLDVVTYNKQWVT